MHGDASCARCERASQNLIRCSCGRLVGASCCWSHVDSKCFECLQIVSPGARRVRYGYKCVECNVRSEIRENFGFRLIQRIFVTSDARGGQLAQAKNVYVCQECWEDVFEDQASRNRSRSREGPRTNRTGGPGESEHSR